MLLDHNQDLQQCNSVHQALKKAQLSTSTEATILTKKNVILPTIIQAEVRIST